MNSPSTGSAGPSAHDYAGESPAAVAKRLFNATRPKFFPASVLPVVAGTAWGVNAGAGFDALVFVLALLATVCVHAGANVLNDVGDDAIGTDPINDDRIYPYTGGSRFIQAGILSSSAMARLGITLLVVAAVAGVFLILAKGAVVFWLGVAGVLLAVLYSLGPARLSGLGLGELAVGVAFGVLPVCGAAWLQSGIVDASAVVFALPISIWVANILLINEVPDIRADAASGKRTLPVRLGPSATAIIYVAANAVALAATAWLSWQGSLPLLAPAVPAALLLLALRASPAIRSGIADRAGLTKSIESTLAIHTVGSLWLAACALYPALFAAG
jgi:1,4-dihydroxy-2-naphthoate octaprenyltransferase